MNSQCLLRHYGTLEDNVDRNEDNGGLACGISGESLRVPQRHYLGHLYDLKKLIYKDVFILFYVYFVCMCVCAPQMVDLTVTPSLCLGSSV